MGKNSEAKVQHWKKVIEKNVLSKLLLLEVRGKQIRMRDENDMMIDIVIDFSEETIKKYDHYN